MSNEQATTTRVRKPKEITPASVIADITKIKRRADAQCDALLEQLPEADRARVIAFFAVGG